MKSNKICQALLVHYFPLRYPSRYPFFLDGASTATELRVERRSRGRGGTRAPRGRRRDGRGGPQGGPCTRNFNEAAVCELAALRRSSPERGTALAVEAAGGDRDEEQLVTRLAAESTATMALASDSFPKTTHR